MYVCNCLIFRSRIQNMMIGKAINTFLSLTPFVYKFFIDFHFNFLYSTGHLSYKSTFCFSPSHIYHLLYICTPLMPCLASLGMQSCRGRTGSLEKGSGVGGVGDGVGGSLGGSRLVDALISSVLDETDQLGLAHLQDKPEKWVCVCVCGRMALCVYLFCLSFFIQMYIKLVLYFYTYSNDYHLILSIVFLSVLFSSFALSCGTNGSIGSSRLLGRESGGEGVLWGVSSSGGLGRGNHSDEFFSAPVHPQTQTDFMNYLFDSALQEEEVMQVIMRFSLRM